MIEPRETLFDSIYPILNEFKTVSMELQTVTNPAVVEEVREKAYEQRTTCKETLRTLKIDFKSATSQQRAGMEKDIDHQRQELKSSAKKLRSELEKDVASQLQELKASIKKQKAQLEKEISKQQQKLDASITKQRLEFKNLHTKKRAEFEKSLAEKYRTTSSGVKEQNPKKRPIKVIQAEVNRLDRELRKKLRVVRSMEYNTYSDFEMNVRDMEKYPRIPIDELAHPYEHEDLHRMKL